MKKNLDWLTVAPKMTTLVTIYLLELKPTADEHDINAVMELLYKMLGSVTLLLCPPGMDMEEFRLHALKEGERRLNLPASDPDLATSEAAVQEIVKIHLEGAGEVADAMMQILIQLDQK